MEAEHQRRGEQQNRDALPQKGEKPQPAGKAAEYLRRGHGNETDQDALRKGLDIFRFQQPHPHRNGERQRASQRGGHQNARIKADGGIGGEIDRRLVAAHIDGDKAAQHAGVKAEQIPEGSERQGKPPDDERGKTENARHGERRGPQQAKALLKSVAQTQPVAE